MKNLKRNIVKKGARRVIVEGLALLLLFLTLRYVFNLLVLPIVFPDASDLARFHIGSLASLLLGLAFWLGYPFFSIFTFLGLIISRILTAHYTILEGNAFPSLMANVFTTASQGGGFLIGAVSEYAIWFSRRLRELKAPVVSDEAENIFDESGFLESDALLTNEPGEFEASEEWFE